MVAVESTSAAASLRGRPSASSVRVCHVISADLWAGAAVQVYNTVADLHTRGLRPAVAVFNDGILARRLEAEGIDWRLLDERALGPAALVKGLARYVREIEPACLHVHAYKEHILTVAARALARRGRLPLVRTLHGRTYIPATLRGVRRLRARGIELFERALMRRSVLIAVSSDLQDYLRAAYPRTRVELVPNGIRVAADGASRESARARWGIAEGAFWVGCVARLEAVKNVQCLVRAAALLRDEGLSLRVSVFGTGSQQRPLHALISELGLDEVVTLHGFDDRMPSTVAGFDCFVLPSLHEGLPMSLLEAMALGIPAVCSDVGGMRELITPGVTGVLFPANDHVRLADSLRHVRESGDSARRMGLAGQALVRDRYSIEVTNGILMNVYESLLRRFSPSEGGRA